MISWSGKVGKCICEQKSANIGRGFTTKYKNITYELLIYSLQAWGY